MKYQFSKEVNFTPEWNANLDLPEEERVAFVLKVPSMGDVLLLMDTLESAGDKDGNVNEDSLDAGTIHRLVDEARRLLPLYAEMSGLEGADDEVIDVDTICEYPQFIGLITEVLFKLIEISTPNEADTKN